jgi:hypothetical protein
MNSAFLKFLATVSYKFKYVILFKEYLIIYIYSACIITLWNFYFYANWNPSIEEWNILGNENIFNFILNLKKSNLIFPFDLWIFHIFPEAFIDFFIKIFIDDMHFIETKLSYRLLFPIFVFQNILILIKSNYLIKLSIPFIFLSIQILNRLNWDMGSTYSILFFLLIINYSLVNSKRNLYMSHKLMIILFIILITLPMYTNPPSAIAAITAANFMHFIGIKTIKINSKYTNVKNFVAINIIPFCLLSTSGFIFKSKNILEDLSRYSAPELDLLESLLTLQGFGLWWSDQTFVNGVPYNPLLELDLNPILFIARLILIILLIFFVLYFYPRVKSKTIFNYTLIVPFLLLYFVLSINAVDVWGHLTSIWPILEMFREPNKKFLPYFYLIQLLLISELIKIKLKNILLVNIFVIVLFSLFVLFDPESRQNFQQRPNIEKFEVRKLVKELELVRSELKFDGGNLCFRASGDSERDTLIYWHLNQSFPGSNGSELSTGQYYSNKCKRRLFNSYLFIFPTTKKTNIQFLGDISCIKFMQEYLTIIDPKCYGKYQFSTILDRSQVFHDTIKNYDRKTTLNSYLLLRKYFD